MSDLPLHGLLVVDLSQFLSGPLASLRLADLGARVIKIERPGVGDLCRQIYLTDTEIGGDSTLFHAINRNKESLAANLKDRRDLARVRALIDKADVVIQNFRPGVIGRLGLDYATVAQSNPRVVYGTISGYGDAGPWRDRPGQDLLAQARSGLMWLTGDDGEGPRAVGLAVADMLAGNVLVEGLLAMLVRRGVTGRGGEVETSLLEVLLDFQFEVLTTHFNDGRRLPRRAAANNAHAYLAAPYGVYATRDGYLAIAMSPVPRLCQLLGMAGMEAYQDPQSWFDRRDEIKARIADHLRGRDTQAWLDILVPADVWCSEVLDWATLIAHPAFAELDFTQWIERADGTRIQTTRLPLRLDGAVVKSRRAAPAIGEHNPLP